MKYPIRFRSQKKTRKVVTDYKQEMLIRHGREQLEALVRKGLKVPVVLL